MSMSRMLLRVMHHRSQSGYTSISPSHESWRMHVTDCVWYGKVCHLLLVYFLFSSLLYLSVKREKTKQECAWSIVNIQPATNRMYGYCTVLCVIVHIYFTISRYFLRVCNNVSLAIFVVVAFFVCFSCSSFNVISWVFIWWNFDFQRKTMHMGEMIRQTDRERYIKNNKYQSAGAARMKSEHGSFIWFRFKWNGLCAHIHKNMISFNLQVTERQKKLQALKR